MKKLAMLLFLLPGSLHAQQRVDTTNFYYGITLGGDLGTLTNGVYALEGQNGGSNSEQSMQLGFAGGLQFDYILNQSWTLSANALYVQKGTELNFQSYPYHQQVTTSVNLNYLEIPLLAEWTPGAISLFAGPSMEFLLSGEMQWSGEGSGSNSLFQLYQPSISAIAGVGFRFHFGNIPASLSASYDYNLTTNTFNYEYFTAETRDIRLMMSILFWNN